jgi:hypothetical protein
MATSLDTTALFTGPSTTAQQERHRERITVAAYNDARNNRTQSTIFAFCSLGHILIVLFGFAHYPDFMQQMGAMPLPAIGLALWILCDVVYLCCYPSIWNKYQGTMDMLEGKTSRNRR